MKRTTDNAKCWGRIGLVGLVAMTGLLALLMGCPPTGSAPPDDSTAGDVSGDPPSGDVPDDNDDGQDDPDDGLDDPDDPGDAPLPIYGSMSGRLTVQVDIWKRSVVETEPNDDLDEAQTIGKIAADQEWAIFGEIHADGEDPWDVYYFEADTVLQVHLTLTTMAETSPVAALEPGQASAVEADLDVAVLDFATLDCFLKDVPGQPFTWCADDAGSEAAGQFEMTGDFAVFVRAADGGSSYQLDLLISDGFEDAAAAAPTLATAGPAPTLGHNEPSDPAAIDPHRARTADTQETGLPGDRDRSEIMVRFDAALGPDTRKTLLREHDLDLIECSPSGLCRARRLDTDGDTATSPKSAARRRAALAEAVTQLNARPHVRFAETNSHRHIAAVPDDEYYPLQWHYDAINLPAAWDVTVGDDAIIVAVVDTGIVSAHPDLAGRLTGGYDFVDDVTSARDGDGRDADPEDPGDLFGGPGQSSFHGTHVAGTIAATTDNGLGVAGVTWATKVMPLRALGMNGGTAFDVAEAIRYAAGLPNISGEVPVEPARIVNLSLVGAPGDPPTQAETSAIQDATAAGVLVIAAAGNQRSTLPAYPAATTEAVSVGAVDIQLQLAVYSNSGDTVDLVAPGGFTGTDLNGDGFADGVLSVGANDLSGDIAFEYMFSNGTSMAAPHVCGVAALALAVNPDLTPDGLRDVLESTALDLGSFGPDDTYGHGLIDASAAVREAQDRAGAAVSDRPGIGLSTRFLDFGADLDELRVRVANTGGGFLVVQQVQVDTVNGAGWLSVETSGTSDDDQNIDALYVTVDRNGLPENLYRGTITIIAADLDPVVLDVSMIVGDPPVLAETIYVLAVDPDTLQTQSQTQTNGSRDYVYSIFNLEAGDYVIYAGTDRDQDGFICEEGDLCGALPSSLEPRIVNLDPGEQRLALDFSVAQVIIQQGLGPAGGLPSPLPQRLPPPAPGAP